MDAQTEGATLTVAEEPELRRETYRVFKLDDYDEVKDRNIWHELPEMSGEGKYGFRPTAPMLGEAHGPGEFMLVETGKSYQPARFVTVVAETVYRQAEDEAVPE